MNHYPIPPMSLINLQLKLPTLVGGMATMPPAASEEVLKQKLQLIAAKRLGAIVENKEAAMMEEIQVPKTTEQF